MSALVRCPRCYALQIPGSDPCPLCGPARTTDLQARRRKRRLAVTVVSVLCLAAVVPLLASVASSRATSKVPTPFREASITRGSDSPVSPFTLVGGPYEVQWEVLSDEWCLLQVWDAQGNTVETLAVPQGMGSFSGMTILYGAAPGSYALHVAGCTAWKVKLSQL